MVEKSWAEIGCGAPQSPSTRIGGSPCQQIHPSADISLAALTPPRRCQYWLPDTKILTAQRQ
jgi:hypothetical protein